MEYYEYGYQMPGKNTEPLPFPEMPDKSAYPAYTPDVPAAQTESTSTLKYPDEVALIHRQQTFYINSFLNAAQASKGQAPLTIYDSMNGHFSRYEACLINKDKKAATANMSVSEVLKAGRLTDAAYRREADMKMAGSSGKNGQADSPAWNTRFVAGSLKGLSPAQVLAEKGAEGEKLLNSQYAWLKSNLAKYPGNQKLMDAIGEAASLYKQGKLSQAAAPSKFVIHESGMRPLIRRTREDGKCFIYQIKIEWTFGAPNPVTVEIENYYAPVIKKDDGTLNVIFRDRDQASIVRNSMNLSADEWADVMYLIRADMRRFEIANARDQYKQSAAARQAARR